MKFFKDLFKEFSKISWEKNNIAIKKFFFIICIIIFFSIYFFIIDFILIYLFKIIGIKLYIGV